MDFKEPSPLDGNFPLKVPLPGKPSARDVAKLAGVSQTTVSRVLNSVPSNYISEKTRQRVLQVASELGYSPNPIAQALRGKQSHLLGLIVREIGDPFFAKFIAQFSTQARGLGYHIVLGHAESDPEKALEMSEVLDTRHTDGVFILGDLHGDENALVKMLQHNRAIIALCRGPSPASVCTINSDSRDGIKMLMEHLTGLGHRKFGFVDGGWLGDIRERKEAFLEFVRQSGLPLEPGWVQSDVNSAEGGYKAAWRILSSRNRPTALFASDDVMAIGVIKAVYDAGYRVPEDISVVGFDNIEFTQYLNPGLTTIRQPVEAMCSQALQLMLHLIENPDTNLPQTVFRLAPELVIRDSTGPAPQPLQ